MIWLLGERFTVTVFFAAKLKILPCCVRLNMSRLVVSSVIKYLPEESYFWMC